MQRLLKGRNPRIAAPRSATSPILLNGLAFCNLCQGAMSLRTGTSKTGKVHRYYACSTCARKGKKACPVRTVQMDRLDNLVTKHLMDKLRASRVPVDVETAALHPRACQQLENAIRRTERPCRRWIARTPKQGTDFSAVGAQRFPSCAAACFMAASVHVSGP